MLESTHSASERRADFKNALGTSQLLRLPGAFNGLVARLIAEAGFEGTYLSGAALSASLALPDLGLTTLSEVAQRAAEITRACDLPVLVDADTGFGEPLNAARTMQLLEDAGASGCHLEDQVNPKRCGHLDGKQVVSRSEMVRRIAAACAARRDANFVLCARTDARAIEGIDGAIERAKAYVDAGADLIFPEALTGPSEFAAFAEAVPAPILANMTEFGKSELCDTATLRDCGVRVVIYPVTTLRLAMGAVERGLRELATAGTQAALIGEMQTRARLYEVLDYDAYGAFDSEVYRRSLSEVPRFEEGSNDERPTAQ